MTKFITDAEVAAVARLYGIPMVVAYGLAADVQLERALRADREQRRDQQLAERENDQ